MKKLIITADIKKYLPLLLNEEITTSRFAEILNERANTVLEEQKLLKIYNKGWRDGLEGEIPLIYKSNIKQKAYELGWQDAWAGDDVSDVDLQTDREILNRIKNQK